MKNITRKKFYILLSFFALCLLLGVIFGVLSKAFEDDMPIKLFSKTLHNKENIAEENLKSLKNQIITAQNTENIISKINSKNFELQDIFYYIVENGQLIYWSDNQLDIKSLDTANLKNNAFVELSNASCLLKTDTIGNFNLLALIKLKNNYGVNNKYVTSDFAKGFKLDNSVKTACSRQKEGAIYNSHGGYAFSLLETKSVHHNRIFFYLYTFFLFFSFFLYGLLYYNIDIILKKRVNFKKFLLITAFFILIPTICLILKIPITFFEHRIFSPILYSDVLPSLGHLLIVTLIAVFVAFTLYYKVFFEVKYKILFIGALQIVLPLFFLMIIRIISNIIYNSTLEVFTFPPQNNEIYSIIALVIVVLWFIIFCYCYRKFTASIQQFLSIKYIILTNIAVSLLFGFALFLLKNPNFLLFSLAYFALISLITFFMSYKTAYPIIGLFVICYFISIFIVYYTVENQQDNQYKTAEIVATNLISQVDEVSLAFLDKEFLLTLENNILNDENIDDFVKQQPNKDLIHTTRLLQYIKKYYINRNISDSYNLNIVLIPRFSPEIERYNNLIHLKFKLITHNFYYNVQQNQKLAYIGIFNYFDSTRPFHLVLEIEKKINTSVLHGYPDIIFDNNTNNYSQKFSSALYKKNNLVYENGYFPYPTESNFKIKNQKNKSVNFENYIHYIFEYNDDLQIVVSCKQQNIHNTYILNFTYIIFFFCIFILSIKLIFKEKKLQKEKSITDNLQKSFIYIIIFALSIVVLSMTFFIYREYRELQKHDLETKMKYIYADISNYFMEKKVNISDIPVGYDSNFIDFATVLSRKYDTDIQIYNTDGELVVTSRPYVFINGLSASLIDPVYFFDKQKNNVIKIENIGSLKYLSIYSAFLDADKKAVAYLEIPMFFSMEQLRSETILYIATIANTFFIILIGAILLNFWLSQRITLSISKISESLKNIVVSGKNLKMEVKQNGRMDEIEKLMLQYNLMVDELEKNTQILLENERNFAWRDMAKQIAHEIKNPLTPMKLAIQQLQRIKEVKPSEFDNYFDNMSSILIEQIDNLSKIASSFSNFAKVQIENFQKIDITQKLFSAVELFKNNTKNIEIIYEKPSEPIFVTTDNEQIIEVFNNLFRNAIQAIPSNRKGKIVVSSVISGENVFISIGDNGCGISDEIGKNIFMPNFSTKNSGTGLGLSIVKHIIEVSNGKIWFKSKINRGTTFFIELKVKN